MRERKPYKDIAEILARATGCFVTEQHIKDIRVRRDQIPRQCVFQLSAKDIEFARGYGSNPIAIIAESQFAEIWERRLAAPPLRIGAAASPGETPNSPPRPEPNWRIVCNERFQRLAPDSGPEEGRLRAIEFTVGAYRNHHGVDFETAKAAILGILNRGAAA